MSEDEEHKEEDMIIDTSGMSEGKRQALELAESSRDKYVTHTSFVGSLFMGRFDGSLVSPFPMQSDEDRAEGDVFLATLDTFLSENLDADKVDETGEIPPEVIKELGDMGAFAIKIKKEYGGLGMSQTNYSRSAIMLGSHCGSTTALVSARQSIGVPQPLILFGTEEQKQEFLPRFGKGRGEISAFALTETGVGSDPARLETIAEPTEDGEHFIINGEKLWCTNGTIATVIVVMAKTPSREIKGKMRDQVTAFVVDMDTPGVEVVRRCHFLGLKALYNGVIRFTDVKIPRKNIVLGEGRGLKVALATLNTGRLTLPAACIGLMKRCLEICREWAGTREQWGAPVGHHAAIAEKIARLAADTYATEAMTLYTSALVDSKKGDIRLEAAMCKMWGTEAAWHHVDETLQIRGGRGYETAASLKARGDDPVPIERLLRDCRINTVFEGSSEIMRLFIAREALDPHLKAGAAVLNTRLSMGERFGAAIKAAGFYGLWYPKQWLPALGGASGIDPVLSKHIRYAARGSKKLARSLFHQMIKHGPKLEREQVVLGHLVDIGAELFAISVTCSYASSQAKGDAANGIELADYFCREARLRIEDSYRAIRSNNNHRGYNLARKVLDGAYRWHEKGIVDNP